MQSSPRQARVVTVLNLKGGVGKTHTVWMLAAVAQERAMRTLLIDLDSQGNLTSSFLELPDGKPGVEQLFDPRQEPLATSLIRRTAYEHLDLLPAFPTLSSADLSQQMAWEANDLHLSLREALRPLVPQYDLVFIDCPPRISLVSMAALAAADGLVIPLEAADWGAQGVAQVTEAFKYVRGRYNPKLRLLGYLVSRFKRARALQRGYRQQLIEHFGHQVFDTAVPDQAAFERSVCLRVPITEHAPDSTAASIARELFDEVLARVEQGRANGEEPRGSNARANALARIG